MCLSASEHTWYAHLAKLTLFIVGGTPPKFYLVDLEMATMGPFQQAKMKKKTWPLF